MLSSRLRLRKPAVPFAVLALALAAGALAAALSGRSAGPLRAFLPDDRSVPGWARDGELQEFEGEDLYTYIDGGAEIYEEYGFTRVIVQDYRSDKDRSVSLEIFEMASPEAAFGMFTFKRSGQGQVLALGGGAELESYYLNFWKGRFLVTLTGFDEAVETANGLAALGRSVEAKLPAGADAPDLIVMLPKEGLRTESVKYLRGILGLNNIYSFRTLQGLEFEAAVKGDYTDGTTLIVMNYRLDWKHGEASLLGLWRSLDQSERFKKVADRVYQDDKGRFLAVSGSPPWIAIGLGPEARSTHRRAESAGDYLIRTVSR